jgi:hypothetical protein
MLDKMQFKECCLSVHTNKDYSRQTPMFSGCLLSVELQLIVHKICHVMLMCEKSARGSAVYRTEVWRKMHNGNADSVLLST